MLVVSLSRDVLSFGRVNAVTTAVETKHRSALEGSSKQATRLP